MTHTILTSCSIVVLALALVGSLYMVAASLSVRHYLKRTCPPSSSHQGVTILKPLCGDEPALYSNLLSFCQQDYNGPVQIVFGVLDGADAAIPVVQRLIAQYPKRDLVLTIGQPKRSGNRKVASLQNLARHVRHDVVILADSDIRVDANYLSSLVAELSQPKVGLVTCLYRGGVAGGLCSRLAAMAIDYHFLPNVLVGLSTGLARPCFGSTIALRRGTLAAIGGFEAFTRHLADDYAIGAAVRRLGLAVRVSTLVVDHTCNERDFGELLRHELRWARTIRAVDIWGFAGSIITYPVPLALLGAGLIGFTAPAAGALAIAIASRLVLQVRVDQVVRSSSGRWWLGPLRDTLSFLVFAASFFVGVVSWRGERYKIRPDGTMIALKRLIALEETGS
jgi:ceramide glucosyltransferase